MIDFIPETVRSPERIKFQVLHMGYAGLEVLQVPASVSCWRGSCWCVRRRKSGQTAGDVDVVDEADHRHVNR